MPLEGITGFAYRNVHRQFFGEEIDKYFSFAAPNYTHNFKTREREDIDPANNEGVRLVPQILTNRAGTFYGSAERNVRDGIPGDQSQSRVSNAYSCEKGTRIRPARHWTLICFWRAYARECTLCRYRPGYLILILTTKDSDR